MNRLRDRNETIHEIGEILAEGYLRLLAQKGAQFKDSDVTAYLTENSAPNPLDIEASPSDVSRAGQPRNSP